MSVKKKNYFEKVMKQRNYFEKIRISIQIIFVLFIFAVSLGHTFNWSFGENVHGVCPFGAVETFHSWLTTGKFVHHTGEGNSFIVLGLLLTLIFTGAFFCGWICPFGSIQEYIGKIGKKIFGKKYGNFIPKKIDHILKYFKYLFLAFILFQTARTFSLVFQNIDPYYTLFNIWSDEIATSGYMVLGIFLSLSFVVERPYCRYACPLGAINGVFNIKSLFTIKRDENTCISCKACDKACPVGIKVSEVKEVKDTKCIRCMRCVSSCPINDKSNTLKITSFMKTRKILSKRTLLIFSLALFIIPIIAGISNNSFEENESDKKYETINDIRGSYTIVDISSHYNIKERELLHAFNLKHDKEQKINVLLEEQGFSTETLRAVLEFLDKPASEVLTKIPDKFDRNLSFRELIKAGEAGEIVGLYANSQEKESVETVIEIKRKSMLVDVKSSVKDYDDFLITFKIPADTNLNTTLRELIENYSLSMEDIKAYIEENKK